MRLYAIILILILPVILMVHGCKRETCGNTTCIGDATCQEGKCICPTGYEGDKCEVLSTNKFRGVWTSQGEVCTQSGSRNGYKISIYRVDDNVNRLKIDNMMNSGITLTAFLTDDTRFNIPSQVFQGNFIAGIGELKSSQLEINYIVFNTGFEDSCKVIFVQ